MSEDPRLAAARYRLDRDAPAAEPGEHAGSSGDPDSPASAAESPTPAAGRSLRPERGATAADRAAYVETAIQQAIRRGEFDDLPGSGRPLDLGGTHDPDWWIRRKIATEKLTGLGPPALLLRVESAELPERLDALAREDDVRDALADFNRRVIEARRQLLGGPPVVTPTRDVDAEVAAWTARRRAREAASAAPDHPQTRRGWRRRRPSPR